MMLRNEIPMEKSVQTCCDCGNELDSYLRFLSTFPGGVVESAVCSCSYVSNPRRYFCFSCEQQLRFFVHNSEQERRLVECKQMYCQSDYRWNLPMIFSSAMTTSSTIRLVRICVGMMTATMVVVSFSFPAVAGTIDATDQYSWGENVGWLVWGTTEGDVFVPESGGG